ncbi:hypothetical protein [Actinoplanes sp. NPDC049118]|uniref:hypothetical protein n=1 Tax=Actinoplanes sp. NPDC049118 TaxID=3155769 RepID=UPI0033F23841
MAPSRGVSTGGDGGGSTRPAPGPVEAVGRGRCGLRAVDTARGVLVAGAADGVLVAGAATPAVAAGASAGVDQTGADLVTGVRPSRAAHRTVP